MHSVQMLSTHLPRLRLRAAASATSVLSYVFHAAATMTLPCRRIECQLTYPKRKAHAMASAQACVRRGHLAAMTTSERRYSHRYGLKLPLVFCSVHSLLTNGHLAESINLSLRGVYFVTSHPVFVGLPVRVFLHMPKRISGEQAADRVFTGRVSHIESKTGLTKFRSWRRIFYGKLIRGH